jgi:hypothetical protein
MGTAMHTVPETMFSTEVPVLHLVNRFWIGGACAAAVSWSPR